MHVHWVLLHSGCDQRPGMYAIMHDLILDTFLHCMNVFVCTEPSVMLLLLCMISDQVTVEVDKDSKEAQKAAERSKPPATGLDAFLSEIEKKKKVR